MSYSTISKTKWGDCSLCENKDCACVKVGKNLVCVPCHRKAKGKEQIERFNERERLRRGGNPKSSAVKTGRELRKLAVEQPEVKAPKGYKSKSELLREADRLFADYIKARDTGKNGRIYCPCCKEYFRATDYEVNCMHFIDRDVYSLRFDEDAAHAGHATCNRNQHYDPKGIEYQNFKQFLVDKFGEAAVEEMELAKRKINKITEQQLKVVIEHYSNQPSTIT